MEETIKLAKQLIQIDSITPDDKGCQDIIAQRLKKLGFVINKLKFGDVDNIWATYGSGSPVFAFAGHTDVVPPGDKSKWDNDPFAANIIGDMLYGRGAADMKGSIAAMIVATEKYLQKNIKHKGTIAFLITSDEEGLAINGTAKVVKHLQEKNQKIDYCLVGEPSSKNTLGDTIKNGRRGSLTATLEIIGKQGHIAYPHLAKNPISMSFLALESLKNEKWDEGNEDFPPTSLQFSNIHSGDGTTNIIPSSLKTIFNFRYSTNSSQDELKKRVIAILNNHQIKYKIDWHHSGDPFLTARGKLVDCCLKAIKEVNSVKAELSTSGGTSDGRFISKMGAELVELGPINASIHKINERVSVKDLNALTTMYEKILINMLA